MRIRRGAYVRGKSGFMMENKEEKIAIVLAQFGTSYPAALGALTGIQRQIAAAFPGVKIRIAFTSDIIRKIWRGRRDDAGFLKENRDIPDEILDVKAPLATLADLQDKGFKTIVVQSTHIFEGEEYLDLKSCVDGLDSINTINPRHKPFRKIVLGRPLLGKKGKEYPYHHDLRVAAEALRPDLDMAKEHHAALVYMGHGNAYLSTGIYMEFQESLRKMYPDTPVYIGCVEGFPSVERVVTKLLRDKIRKVVVKPLMIVAGEHARNDMAGDEEDSWKTIFQANGITFIPVSRGLGENPAIGRIFVQHIKDVARDNRIEL